MTYDWTQFGLETPNQWFQGMSNVDALKGGLGIAQVGLGLASYLDDKKTASKQRELLGQQIAQNRFVLDTAKQRQKDISNAFGGGLAASAMK